MTDMTDATPSIEEMPEMQPSAEERLARKYESGRHAYPSYAKLARERAGDFTLCSIEAIAEAYRDGYTAALSSLSPLIEALNRVLYGQPGYDARRAWEEAKTALSTFPAPASPWQQVHDAEGILVCAVRYCIGRRSYIVGSCDHWLRTLWPSLSAGTKDTILKDIGAALERERMGHADLGMEMDRDIWAALYRDFSLPTSDGSK